MSCVAALQLCCPKAKVPLVCHAMSLSRPLYCGLWFAERTLQKGQQLILEERVSLSDTLVW